MTRKIKKIIALVMVAVFMTSGTALLSVDGSQVLAVDDSSRQVAWYVDTVASNTSGRHTAIKSDGSLWTWFNYNQFVWMAYARLLCADNPFNRPYPVHVLDDVVDFYLASDFYLAITSDGWLWGWGAAHAFPVNITGTTPRTGWDGITRNLPNDLYVPTRIMDNVVYVSRSVRSPMVITADGTLWILGQEPVVHMKNVSRAVHTFALTTNGDLYGWGSVIGLGIGRSEGSQETPVRIMRGVADFYVSMHTLARTVNGDVYAWGGINNAQRAIVTAEMNTVQALLGL